MTGGACTQWKLRIEVQYKLDSTWASSEYSSFVLGDSSSYYTINVTGHVGDTLDGLNAQDYGWCTRVSKIIITIKLSFIFQYSSQAYTIKKIYVGIYSIQYIIIIVYIVLIVGLYNDHNHTICLVLLNSLDTLFQCTK